MSKSVRILLIVLVVFVLSFAYNFFMANRAAQSPAKLRETMSSSALPACVQQAKLKTAGTTVTSQQVDTYCGCVVARGIGSFSDDEIVAAYHRGANLSDGDRTRMLVASKSCSAESFPQR